ncbi:MAG: DinB family protein [Acidobacteria bacterium]|nr:DinB family protein [Acidobacteriota bacterium]MBI3656270.1 DinB family protein [Acidobacteriota bacterium]
MAPPDFIREKTSKYDFTQLVRQLDSSLDAVGAHLNGLTQAQADFKPSDLEWSVGEVIYHVCASVTGMLRITYKLNRNEPFKHAMERSAMGLTVRDVPVDRLRNEWAAMRQELPTKLAALTPPLNEQTTFAHPDYGPLNALEWLALNYLHNFRHAAQIQRIQSSAGYPR